MVASQEIGVEKAKSGLTVAIQAGGESLRMGRDKSFVLYKGRPMIEVVRQQVQDLGDELLIISNNPEPYSYLNLPIVPDAYTKHGPLAGIFTSLKAAAHAHVLVVACDMPLLNKPLLRHLISLKDSADVVVPRWDRFPEPLHAVYGKGCLPFIESDLKSSKLKIIGFYAKVKVRYVGREEIERFDPQGQSFTNVNTPEDLD